MSPNSLDVHDPVNKDGCSSSKKNPRSCPYLDTVNRTSLDFDFEKLCSISLLDYNIYACLTCGKYFQGRSPNTHAYIHSLDSKHHVFINTETKKIYCLPDNYEVIDSSLDDIKGMLDPQLTDQEIEIIDKEVITSRTLDGHQYICGVAGLNTLNKADHINTSIQALAHLPKVRNFFFKQSNYCHPDYKATELISRFGILIRKLWNPHNWRSHISPHEFIQELSLRSKRKFAIGLHGDPLEFYVWLVNVLKQDMKPFVKFCLESLHQQAQNVSDLFCGKIRINAVKNAKRTKLDVSTSGQSSSTIDNSQSAITPIICQTIPFFFLQLDLPAISLYKDEKSINVTPQIPIYNLLCKYDGRTTHFVPWLLETRTYTITKLPKYLVFYIKRFSTNQFLTEKNKTIVNFPVQDLEMAGFIAPEAASDGSTKYDLRSYICHNGDAEKGHYSARIHHQANNKWYDCQNLYISEILPEDHLLAEAYMLFYERQ
ncbi:U4/U6.U5 tri-snRNP-associated protein 2-like [Schistocerca gregaria]|uniref:U4/U6.U5 tri-snRNP-associated protein 2-like n=1 Tax=Schistocerca gregaria TaxID=7010 RepID=UPI00211F3309|nr:U4/U6.U5 tri-snRNP-associated protein 2-like [Schistocerca gregaria]